MIILAHRGNWIEPEEKNSHVAFTRSFEKGYGVETDIRDSGGNLFIAHDMAKGTEMTADDFFKLYNHYSASYPLALNIKSDGLQFPLSALLTQNGIENYFFFDMSLPDALGYAKKGLKFFSRQSEYEKEPYLYNEADGIWLDEFQNHWIDEKVIMHHLINKKKICIVSPELHGRSYKNEWNHYRDIINNFGFENIMLCTDYPEEAKTFFKI